VLRYLRKDWPALTVPVHCLLQQCTITKVRPKWEPGTYDTILRQNSRIQDAFVGHMTPPAKNPYAISFFFMLSLPLFRFYLFGFMVLCFVSVIISYCIWFGGDFYPFRWIIFCSLLVLSVLFFLRVLGAVRRHTQSHAAQHPVHTAHIATAQQQF
jgi:hypothetical protein